MKRSVLICYADGRQELVEETVEETTAETLPAPLTTDELPIE